MVPLRSTSWSKSNMRTPCAGRMGFHSTGSRPPSQGAHLLMPSLSPLLIVT